MPQLEKLTALVAPIVHDLGAELYDLEFAGGQLRITLDREGGIDLDTLAEANRQISRMLDLEDPIPSKFLLEVSSPGLERNLRSMTHWESAIGEQVKIKLLSGPDDQRRIEGAVCSVEHDDIVIECSGGERKTVQFADIERARTHFVWEKGSKKPATTKSEVQ